MATQDTLSAERREFPLKHDRQPRAGASHVIDASQTSQEDPHIRDAHTGHLPVYVGVMLVAITLAVIHVFTPDVDFGYYSVFLRGFNLRSCGTLFSLIFLIWQVSLLRIRARNGPGLPSLVPTRLWLQGKTESVIVQITGCTCAWILTTDVMIAYHHLSFKPFWNEMPVLEFGDIASELSWAAGGIRQSMVFLVFLAVAFGAWLPSIFFCKAVAEYKPQISGIGTPSHSPLSASRENCPVHRVISGDRQSLLSASNGTEASLIRGDAHSHANFVLPCIFVA